MTETEACQIAQREQGTYGVPHTSEIVWAQRRYIELAKIDPDTPSPVRDELVWIVRFQSGSSWIDLAISHNEGSIVRVERSRGRPILAKRNNSGVPT